MFTEPVNFNATEVVFNIGGIPDQTLEAAIDKILEQLRLKYGRTFDRKDIQLESFRHVVWEDSSLGCPEEGHYYLQVETPGYELRFTVTGLNGWIDVHTNADGTQIVSPSTIFNPIEVEFTPDEEKIASPIDLFRD